MSDKQKLMKSWEKRKSISRDLNRSLTMTANNDEAERKQRREEAMLEEKLANISISNSGLNLTINQDGELSFNSMSDHYNLCLKLYCSNKISSKNVWNLDILQYLSAFIKQNDDVYNILQVAGSSLDIGAKIYSLRVDEIHKDILKLANSLSQVHMREKDQTDASSNDENEDGVSEPKAGTRSKKKKRAPLDSNHRFTVLENDEILTAPCKKINRFQEQSSDVIDSNSLLNIKSVKKPGLNYTLLNSYKAKDYPWMQSISNHHKTVHSEETTLINLPALPDLEICPALSNFTIDTWDEDDENSDSDQDNYIGNDANPHLEPEMNVPFPDDLPDIDRLNLSDTESNGVEKQQLAQKSVFITNMMPSFKDNSQVLEYSYRPLPNVSDKYTVSGVWAGPVHWKLKCLRRDDAPYTIKTNNPYGRHTPKKIKRKIPTKVKPFSNKNINKDIVQDILSTSMNSKKKTFKKHEANIFASCTLNNFAGVVYETGIGLMHRSQYKVPIGKELLDLDEDDLSVYDYDNSVDEDYEYDMKTEAWNSDNNEWDVDDIGDDCNPEFEDSYTETYLPDRESCLPTNFAALAALAREAEKFSQEQPTDQDQPIEPEQPADYQPEYDQADLNQSDNQLQDVDIITGYDNVTGEASAIQNLVPDALLPKSQIPYAQKAKRMDMYKLNRAIWSIIETEDKKIDDDEAPKSTDNDDKAPGTLLKKNNTDKNVEGNKPVTTLKNVYKDLPPRITTSMNENLSVALAFVSLLHVAADHNLQLESTGDLSNLIIKIDKN